VMDEVLAVGDMKFQQKCLGRMGDAANSEGRTVLYVSHNMNTIRQLCQRCIVMDHGHVVFDGPTEEAISIYMENNAELSLETDCSGERPYKDLDDKMRINRVRFLEKTVAPIYSSGEKIKLQIEYSVFKPVSDVALRLVLETPDRIRVGMATTEPCLSAQTGEYRSTIELPLDWLAPGRYCCTAVFYSINEFGTDQVHDRIQNAFTFEKGQGTEETNHKAWEHRAWGYMMMPPLSLSSPELYRE